MKFSNDDYPRSSKNNDELTDTVESEHPKHFAAVAEEQIRAMHNHDDGSQVELHEVGSREFIAQSMQGSLEGKLTGNFDGGSNDETQVEGASTGPSRRKSTMEPWRESQQITNAAKIEYEKKSSQGQPQHDLLGKGQSKLYGIQQSVTSAGTAHNQETVMMGCSCGAEWTVTGQSAKTQGAGGSEGVKIEQYGSSGGGSAGYNVSGGAGGERVRYAASGSQQREYK